MNNKKTRLILANHTAVMIITSWRQPHDHLLCVSTVFLSQPDACERHSCYV